MKLIPISEHPDHKKILFDLLAERPSSAFISHKNMPTWEEHCAFVANHPYGVWYLIEGDEQGEVVGSVYMTKPPRPSVAGNEIGIFIFQRFHGRGLATRAVKLLMEKHGSQRYLANIAPTNEASLELFKGLGFTLVQHTYEIFT